LLPRRRAIERRSAEWISRFPIGKSRWQSALEQTGLLSVRSAATSSAPTLERFGLLYRPERGRQVISLDGKYALALTGAVAVALLAEMQYYRDD